MKDLYHLTGCLVPDPRLFVATSARLARSSILSLTGATGRFSEFHVPKQYHRTYFASGSRDYSGECSPRVSAPCLHAVCNCKSTQHRPDPTKCSLTKVAQWLHIVTRHFSRPGGQLLHKLAVEMEAEKHSRANTWFPFGESGHHWKEADIQCLH